ncbi:hypothetical protein ACSS7Z_09135 [Microbacterium sp. A82]|uniref:hypothetical protein n=1 Tax=Microbacterium sp. A82 TaxID=3450452 RepID=UPI003F30E96B
MTPSKPSPSSTGADWQIGLPGTIAWVVCLLAATALVLWQFGGVTQDGIQIQVLNPDLATIWPVMIVALLIVDIVITVAVWLSRRWTPVLAGINVLTTIVGAILIVALLMRDVLLAPDLPQQLAGILDGNTDWRVPTEPLAVIIIFIAVWNSIDCIRKARRSVSIRAVDPHLLRQSSSPNTTLEYDDVDSPA